MGDRLSGGLAHVGGDRGERECHRIFAAIEADPDAIACKRLNDPANRSGFGMMQLDIRPIEGRAFVSRKAPVAEMSRRAAGAGESPISTHMRRLRQRDAMADAPICLRLAVTFAPIRSRKRKL
jgi:hypothetical protein